MKYLMLICVDESAEISAADGDPTAWLADTTERGVRLLGNRLQPVSTATCVRSRNGKPVVTDGPFAETREQVGGFDVIECADLDEAIAIAAAHPAAAVGTVELRPVAPN